MSPTGEFPFPVPQLYDQCKTVRTGEFPLPSGVDEHGRQTDVVVLQLAIVDQETQRFLRESNGVM